MNGFEGGLFDDSDVEDEFQSCCTEDEWQDSEESLAEGSKDDLDEFSLRMFFKGVSASEGYGKGSGVSGIGVVMERSPGVPLIQVQKKLDFHVDELVAEHLALMDGLLTALQNGARMLYAFTDSEDLYYQIAETEILDDQLLVALGHRILELADKLEDFDLQLVSSFELEKPLCLAKEAIGDWSVDNCPICEKAHQHKYQNLPAAERDAENNRLHHLEQNARRRRCRQCSRMLVVTHGGSHMTWWCGHEFCYSCGAEYRNGIQTCHCALWGENSLEPAVTPSDQVSEQWTRESFESLPAIMDEYSEQESAELAMIQRFLAGGFFGPSDHHIPPSRSPPPCSDSYMDTMKDLHQLPWLERMMNRFFGKSCDPAYSCSSPDESLSVDSRESQSSCC
ncbi:hypothetical protein OPV22_016827 [Ensete ventricosum]|uniref:RNase H type-1 domain-containing protein n=1 Tax=Ensete ventricosum TaxID=4639 RepID=A0AAV8QWM4_ENSVE|nr:hypothetical protein OPV22_016827 [Ensete ventricosum]